MNKIYWDKVSRPPLDALKTIGGGRLKGMTDINPVWRLEAATEIFGPCGIGWWYTIKKLWTENGPDGQVLAFALVDLVIRDEEGVSNPIEGIGGSTMIAKEKDGLYASDECYKMAVTDALSVAFKALGFGAEVYAGRWDGTKYKERRKEETPKSQEEARKKLSDLPEDIKTGFKILGLGFNAVWTYCESRSWDNEKILADVNRLVDERNKK